MSDGGGFFIDGYGSNGQCSLLIGVYIFTVDIYERVTSTGGRVTHA